MSNQKTEGNIRKKGRRLLIDFSADEKREVIDNIIAHGDRVREARMQNTSLTVINLIFGGQQA